MGSAQEKRMIVGLDIGTSKVVALVGEIGADGDIEIVGIGSNPSKGMKIPVSTSRRVVRLDDGSVPLPAKRR